VNCQFPSNSPPAAENLIFFWSTPTNQMEEGLINSPLPPCSSLLLLLVGGSSGLCPPASIRCCPLLSLPHILPRSQIRFCPNHHHRPISNLPIDHRRRHQILNSISQLHCCCSYWLNHQISPFFLFAFWLLFSPPSFF
jgi:hypothetical protein